MEVVHFALGDLQTNCYLVSCERTQAAIIIDPADNGDFITEQILARQLTPVAIVLTHGHFDHVLGLLELSLNFPIPVMMHPADTFLIKGAQASARHWLHRQVDPVPLPTATLKAGQQLTFGHQTLTVMETPGHTPGSICLYNQEVVFTGDTLFAEGVGRTDFKYSQPQVLAASLQKIFEFPPEMLIFPGHGEPARLAETAFYPKP